MSRRSLMQMMAATGATSAFATSAHAQGGARAAGFYYPEETELHERTFMQWPVSHRVYDDADFLYDIQDSIVEIASTIVDFEPVVIMAAAEHHRAIKKRISGNVELWDIPTDDLWCRDSGPSFIVDGKGGLALTQFNFNGWGNKQFHENDGKIAARVAEHMGLRIFNTGLVGEVGGVETDGQGTLIAHESSFINPNRNRGTKAQIEQMLLDTMGAEKLIWAPGIVGADITDYHIDALARFVKPGQIVIQMGEEVDPSDPWSAAAFETRSILAAATDAKGRRFDLVTLPEPYDIRSDEDDFVSSYVNYYVCNGAVIAAEFGDPEADEEAAEILADLYPDREIVMLDIDPIGEIGGGIHCATHEQPKV